MKRLSVLSILMALAALGILAGSASAAEPGTVLCKTNPSTHKCSTADIYPKGTAITGKLASGSKLIITEPGGHYLTTCTGSEFTNTIKVTPPEAFTVRMQMTNFTVSGCSEETSMILTENQESIWHTAGTDNGIEPGRTEIRFGLGKYLADFGYPEGNKYKCRYQMTEGTLVGGVTASLVYNKGYGYQYPNPLYPENPEICPLNIRISASWTISNPTPLYVEDF